MQGRKATLDKRKLRRMYVTDGLSQTEIARQLDVNKDVVRRYTLEMGIWQKRNGGGGRLGRKCLSCGEIYSEPTMFLGIMRCPKCFSFENYEPMTPNAKSHKWTPFTFGYDIPYYEDNGCPEAEAMVGHPVKCLECPLDECIHVVIANKHCSTKRAMAMVKCEATV